MANQIINYSELFEEYGEMTEMIIQTFESTCFDQRMEGLLQGMLNKDWIAAMINSDTLRGSAGYIKAKPFIETVKVFQEFVKIHCAWLVSQENEPAIADRPNYKLIDEFDDEKKLQAYEYFHPIIELARLLKFEMQRYTKSQVAEDIFLAEGEKIKQLHQELIEHPIGNQGCDNLNLKGSTFHFTRILYECPLEQNQNTILESPKFVKCCDKCAIF